MWQTIEGAGAEESMWPPLTTRRVPPGDSAGRVRGKAAVAASAGSRPPAPEPWRLGRRFAIPAMQGPETYRGFARRQPKFVRRRAYRDRGGTFCTVDEEADMRGPLGDGVDGPPHDADAPTGTPATREQARSLGQERRRDRSRGSTRLPCNRSFKAAGRPRRPGTKKRYIMTWASKLTNLTGC